jgi:PhnB protein
MAVKRVPEGYHTVSPYLIVSGAARAIDFYKRAFGATERMRFPTPDGKIAHAELQIGDSVVMLADEAPEMGFCAPPEPGKSPVTLAMYVEDVDAVFKQAIAAGAKEMRPLMNQFYGDRSGTMVDPFGHVWTVASHVEDVTPEEMERRMSAMESTSK